jgi:hypothetical protein
MKEMQSQMGPYPECILALSSCYDGDTAGIACRYISPLFGHRKNDLNCTTHEHLPLGMLAIPSKPHDLRHTNSIHRSTTIPPPRIKQSPRPVLPPNITHTNLYECDYDEIPPNLVIVSMDIMSPPQLHSIPCRRCLSPML